MKTLRESLTPRQLQVVEMVWDGAEYKEIASKLGISIDIVKKHMRNVYERTGCENKVMLVLRYERESLVSNKA